MSFERLVANVGGSVAEAIEHQDMPFDTLVNALRIYLLTTFY